MNAKLGGVRSFLQVSVTDSPAATKGKPVKAVVAKHADKKAAEKPKFDPQAAVAQMDKMGPAQMPAMLGNDSLHWLALGGRRAVRNRHLEEGAYPTKLGVHPHKVCVHLAN